MNQQVMGIESAQAHYRWATSWTDPQTGQPVHSGDWASTRISLSLLRDRLLTALAKRSEPDTYKACLVVLKWGGVSGAVTFLTVKTLANNRLKKISALHNCSDITNKKVHPMSLHCPRCHSPKVASFHQAMKVGAAIGTAGGVARGVSAALTGGRAGALIGTIAGPFGITLGYVSGAILGGLAGGVGGCALGAQLGDTLDRHVLAHNLCLLCGHRFNLPV